MLFWLPKNNEFNEKTNNIGRLTNQFGHADLLGGRGGGVGALPIHRSFFAPRQRDLLSSGIYPLVTL